MTIFPFLVKHDHGTVFCWVGGRDVESAKRALVAAEGCPERCVTPIEINARFWVWWHDGWVKLTLRPQESLSAGHRGRHEEGWYSYDETWTHEGDRVVRECFNDGADCDGPSSKGQEDSCPLGRLSEVTHEKQTPWIEGVGCEFVPDPDAPLTPDWEKVSESQRDVYAEQMGH